MNSREIIKKVIEFGNPPRIGLDFNEPNQKDIAWIPSARLINREYAHLTGWGYYPEVLKEVPGFTGQVLKSAYGNIYGRLGEKTNGECIKGGLQDGWELLDAYPMPEYDESYEKELQELFVRNKGRFLLGVLPASPFSTMRDLRRIDNLLMDVALEQEMVSKLLEKIKPLILASIDRAAGMGFDGVIIYEDWGTQQALLIGPSLWRILFKPVYAKIVDRAHARGMKFFVHSCGYIYEIIEDFIEIGVDVLQLDQPELMGVERLAEKFGGRVAFWSPVDIQKIMQTGNRELIEAGARRMMEHFGSFKGGFIAKDYPTWEDINVKDEWAQWARDIFISDAAY